MQTGQNAPNDSASVEDSHETIDITETEKTDEPEESEKPEERLRQQVEIWPGRTIVKTKGELENRMTFCMGKRLQADYRTPYGEMPIEVLTRKHQVKKDAELGYSEVVLGYTLYLKNDYLGDYQMKIEIEKEK